MDERSRSFLTVINGASLGSRYPLDPSTENRIGRGLDCQIALNDPRCSRLHASLVGFPSIGDSGQLLSKRVIPTDWSERLAKSRSTCASSRPPIGI